MNNLRNSEILKSFDEKREVFKPYGLTFEKWKTSLMGKFDRHNEIEINYFPQGGISYFFQNHKVEIPAGRMAIFWGLMPHKIIAYEEETFYFVCTIPLTLFLSWELPSSFVNTLLKGEVLIEEACNNQDFDTQLFENWLNDSHMGNAAKASLYELQGRLLRMCERVSVNNQATTTIHTNELNLIEQIAIYIAKNYNNPIKISDIGKSVGLHPDYANAIFKKTFGRTLSEHITIERITHAQRKLITTDSSILDIALDCGFNSISSFNASFRKLNNCTPREYRQQFL